MSEREEPLPAKIDRYEPLKRIAVGGMAEIFLAKQSGLEGFEKVVVLKRILSNLASDDEFVAMFLDEARIAAKLSHPNIVQIYDLGKADNTYYIAMEYVSGRNVQHLINKQQDAGGHLPVEHVCRIIAGVCDGLYYAHSRKDYDGKALNIVHRDISPQNILVSFAGGVKVVDFGIAKASTQLAQTRAGVLKGKYAYMSPEQVRGAKIDHRSDLFAVGLVMYEMLTGLRAFERDTSLKTLKAIVQEKPLNPREANPEIPPEVVKLLSKALEKNPDKRYKTAQEMQLALEDFLEQSPKKSNNVRLSRFLYELFDDELNSAEGTLIVKGVGQIIIPASPGPGPVKPAFEEELDSKTVTQALVSDAGVAPAAENKPAHGERPNVPAPTQGRYGNAWPVVVSPTSIPPSSITGPPEHTAPPMEEQEDSDDKTTPSYDAAQFEAAMAQRVGAAQTTGELPDEPPPQASQPQTGTKPAAAGDSEAVARALLSKVEALAKGDLHKGNRVSPTVDPPQKYPLPTIPPKEGPKVTWGGGLVVQGGGPVAPAIPAPVAPDFHSSGNSLNPSPFFGPQPTTQPSEQEDSSQASEPVAPLFPTSRSRPPVFFYAMGASVGMAAVALLLILVGVLVLPPATPPVEFGVVAITTSPAGATVLLNGIPIYTPGQILVPLDGVERTVDVVLPGFATKQEKLVFAPAQNFSQLSVTLEPKI